LFRVSVATVTLVFRGFGVEMTGVPRGGAVGCSMIAGHRCLHGFAANWAMDVRFILFLVWLTWASAPVGLP
jgi:hypothetical protein